MCPSPLIIARGTHHADNEEDLLCVAGAYGSATQLLESENAFIAVRFLPSEMVVLLPFNAVVEVSELPHPWLDAREGACHELESVVARARGAKGDTPHIRLLGILGFVVSKVTK